MKNELTVEQISTLVKFSAHEDTFINEVGYDVFGRKLNVGDLVYAVSTQSGGKLSRRVGYVGGFKEKKISVYVYTGMGQGCRIVSFDGRNLIKIDSSFLDSVLAHRNLTKKETETPIKTYKGCMDCHHQYHCPMHQEGYDYNPDTCEYIKDYE